MSTAERTGAVSDMQLPPFNPGERVVYVGPPEAADFPELLVGEVLQPGMRGTVIASASIVGTRVIGHPPAPEGAIGVWFDVNDEVWHCASHELRHVGAR